MEIRYVDLPHKEDENHHRCLHSLVKVYLLEFLKLSLSGDVTGKLLLPESWNLAIPAVTLP